MKLSIRFSGLFTLANGLKKTGGTVDPSSKGDILFADASTWNASGCTQFQPLPPHLPILALKSSDIDWKAQPVPDVGRHLTVNLPGSNDPLCIWDLSGAVVTVAEYGGAPVSGGVDYDDGSPAGKEESLKWLLSLSELNNAGAPLKVRADLFDPPPFGPGLLCRVELRAGQLESDGIFKDQNGKAIEFVAIDHTGSMKGTYRRALARGLRWSHQGAAGTLALTISRGERVPPSIPLVNSAEAYIQSEPGFSPTTKGSAEHLLATYQFLDPPPADPCAVWIPVPEDCLPPKLCMVTAGGTHCPPDQVP